MKLVINIAALLTLTACATSTDIYDQNGQPAKLISCDGAMLPMSKCYEKAAEVCPNGYVHLGAETQNADAVVSPSFGGSVIYKSLAVRCKG